MSQHINSFISLLFGFSFCAFQVHVISIDFQISVSDLSHMGLTAKVDELLQMSRNVSTASSLINCGL